MSKCEAIHIGKDINIRHKPFEEDGLTWRTQSFKALGVSFSLHVKSLYELNFIPKLQKMEQTIHCWSHRGLSLIGKIAVIKALVLPQMLYLFSVLCIPLPKSFF